nr:MAG TPA: tail completion protein [Caudoviricetes sp.]
MIEKTVLDYLRGTLSVPVYLEIPENPPQRFVLVEKTGGGKSNRLNRATIAVQSWAAALLGAAQLNEDVKAVMDGLTDLDAVSACRLNSDYNFTDTTTKHYRYQAVFDLVFY